MKQKRHREKIFLTDDQQGISAEHGNVGNITDEGLYNGFVWVEKDGRAASMYYGKKIIWSVVTGVEEVQKMSLYQQVCYAMLAATYPKDDLTEAEIEPVKILVQPSVGKPFLISAKCHDTRNTIIRKLQKYDERINSYASKNADGRAGGMGRPED